MADVDAAVIAAAKTAADVAGAIIRPLFRTGVSADRKSDASPVTAADRGAEAAMRALLTELTPAFGIHGEEFGLERRDARWRWTLDPIDGTRAFITGRLTFGTLIGLCEDGVPVLGIIDQPVTGERWIGISGRKTVYEGRFGGIPGCRPCATLDAAELSCTSPEMFTPGEWSRWLGLSRDVRRSSFGGDCYAYGLMALGQLDVIAESDMKVWDWAALRPVVEGAGGRMANWRGEPLVVAPDSAPLAGSVLAVGDPALMAPSLQRLAPAKDGGTECGDAC